MYPNILYTVKTIIIVTPYDIRTYRAKLLSMHIDTEFTFCPVAFAVLCIINYIMLIQLYGNKTIVYFKKHFDLRQFIYDIHKHFKKNHPLHGL